MHVFSCWTTFAPETGLACEKDTLSGLLLIIQCRYQFAYTQTPLEALIVSTNILHMPFSGRKNAHTHQFRQYCSFWCFKSQYCVFIQLSEVFHGETSRKQIEHREVGSEVVCMCAALSL